MLNKISNDFHAIVIYQDNEKEIHNAREISEKREGGYSQDEIQYFTQEDQLIKSLKKNGQEKISLTLSIHKQLSDFYFLVFSLQKANLASIQIDYCQDDNFLKVLPRILEINTKIKRIILPNNSEGKKISERLKRSFENYIAEKKGPNQYQDLMNLAAKITKEEKLVLDRSILGECHERINYFFLIELLRFNVVNKVKIISSVDDQFASSVEIADLRNLFLAILNSSYSIDTVEINSITSQIDAKLMQNALQQNGLKKVIAVNDHNVSQQDSSFEDSLRSILQMTNISYLDLREVYNSRTLKVIVDILAKNENIEGLDISNLYNNINRYHGQQNNKMQSFEKNQEDFFSTEDYRILEWGYISIDSNEKEIDEKKKIIDLNNQNYHQITDNDNLNIFAQNSFSSDRDPLSIYFPQDNEDNIEISQEEDKISISNKFHNYESITKSLVTRLQQNNISSLILNGNGMDGNDQEDFLNMLSQKQSMKNLILNGGDYSFDSEFIAKILKILENDRSIVTLSLANNLATPQLWQDLAKMLKKNNTIKIVILSCDDAKKINFDKKIITESIIDIMNCNNTINNIDIGGYFLAMDDYQKIFASLKNNKSIKTFVCDHWLNNYLENNTLSNWPKNLDFSENFSLTRTATTKTIANDILIRNQAIKDEYESCVKTINRYQNSITKFQLPQETLKNYDVAKRMWQEIISRGSLRNIEDNIQEIMKKKPDYINEEYLLLINNILEVGGHMKKYNKFISKKRKSFTSSTDDEDLVINENQVNREAKNEMNDSSDKSIFSNLRI